MFAERRGGWKSWNERRRKERNGKATSLRMERNKNILIRHNIRCIRWWGFLCLLDLTNLLLTFSHSEERENVFRFICISYSLSLSLSLSRYDYVWMWFIHRRGRNDTLRAVTSLGVELWLSILCDLVFWWLLFFFFYLRNTHIWGRWWDKRIHSHANIKTACNN